jgi:hypothetical protein
MAEFDDDFYYSDYDDFDEADKSLREQTKADAEVAWKVLVRELNLAVNSNPMPGMPWPEYVRRVFRVEYFPLPFEPRVDFLRNLYSELGYANARRCVEANDCDVAWWGGQFLFHRSEALGRWCYNTNCLARLPIKTGHQGRPRYYCPRRIAEDGIAGIVPERHDKYGNPVDTWIDCKEAGKKRHERNATDPHRTERFRPMLVPGYPFTTRPLFDRLGIHWPSDPVGRKVRRAKNAGLIPQADELRRQRDLERAAASPLTTDKAMARWQSRRDRGTRVGDVIPLEQIVVQVIGDGYVFPDDVKATIEEMLGRTIESLIAADDLVDGDEGPAPLSQRTIAEIEGSNY